MMEQNSQIGEVVIIGGGPVGNFSAVMAGMLGLKCTVYQKRPSYTRQINIKIEKEFFKQVHETMTKLGRCDRQFFNSLNNIINQKSGKIMLKNLEIVLKEEAQNLGIKYIVGKEIRTFQQAEKLHNHNNPVILDCSGRNSFLRINQFGTDDDNMQIYNLHHALHINFKANFPRNFNFKLLYPVLKNSDNLKLGQVIVSKKKDNENSSHVTVPLFISENLSNLIDKQYPNINRNPLKPFSAQFQGSKIIQEVEEVINSLFCALVMEDWEIDWSTVLLKKINITCGFGINRSKNKYICLGDSAAHFAYFKSLNFGLKHAFEFMKILASYPNLKYHLVPFDEEKIISQFKRAYPLLQPQTVKNCLSPSHYFVMTSQFPSLGKFTMLAPYIFDIRTNTARRIDLLPNMSQQKIQKIFVGYAKQQKQIPWQIYVDQFQKDRKKDIDNEIDSNLNKRTNSEVISYFIWLNSLSPIKISETISLIQNGYYLSRKDFEYFGEVIHEIKLSMQNWVNYKDRIQKKIEELLNQYGKQLPAEYTQFLNNFNRVYKMDKFNSLQFCQIVLNFNWNSKANKYKDITLFYKATLIMGKLLSDSKKLQSNNKKQEISLLE